MLCFITFLCDFVTVTRFEHKPTCLGLISVLFKGNKWQKASVSNYSCFLIRIVGFHCTESMRVIGCGYFLVFLATFLTLLFSVYKNTAMPFFCFTIIFFLTLHSHGIERHKRLRAIKMIRVHIYI